MPDRCEIHALLPRAGAVCAACATAPEPRQTGDRWAELRAVASAPEPEPFVLSISG